MAHLGGSVSQCGEPHKFFACSDQPARQRPQVPRPTALDRRGSTLLEWAHSQSRKSHSRMESPRRPRRDPGPSASPPPRAQRGSPEPLPGPPRSRPASRACRFHRAQEPPRRPEWTPKPSARGPRRTLIPTRVPPRGLDTRRLQEPPPTPPPQPPPPLARRGGEGMWRGRPRSASAPPPLRLAPPRDPAPSSPEHRTQPPTSGSRTSVDQCSGLSADPLCRSCRAPGTRDPALNGACSLGPGGRAPSAHVCAHPLHFYFSNLGYERKMPKKRPPKGTGPLLSANDSSKDPNGQGS